MLSNIEFPDVRVPTFVERFIKFKDGIRKSATDSLLEIVRSFYELSDPQEWQPGSTVSFLWSIGTSW